MPDSTSTLAEVKISELPVADQANATDLLEASQIAGPQFVSRSISLDQVATVVADSDQLAETIAEAIDDIPPLTWDNITGKPITFPPTVPIAWTDVAGKPATFPPTVPIAYSNISGTPTIPTTLPPSGAAGGDLAGSYPNPTVKPSVTNGQVLTTVAGVSAWATPAAPPPSTFVGTTPPGSPTDGQLWYFSDASNGGGALYIRYNDGNSTAWVPASPAATPGSLLQTVFTETGAVASGTGTFSGGDTMPTITGGDQYMTLAITPRSATSKLIIEVTWIGSLSTAVNSVIVALFQDATTNALAAAIQRIDTATALSTISFRHTMTSGATSATTFRVRAGAGAAATTTFNGASGTRWLAGVMASSIVIQEVA